MYFLNFLFILSAIVIQNTDSSSKKNVMEKIFFFGFLNLALKNLILA